MSECSHCWHYTGVSSHQAVTLAQIGPVREEGAEPPEILHGAICCHCGNFSAFKDRFRTEEDTFARMHGQLVPSFRL